MNEKLNRQFVPEPPDEKGHLRYHDKCCHTCRFIRIRLPSSECLMLGRTMVSSSDTWFHYLNNRTRVCDFWSKRPKGWVIHTDDNPHWKDKYYPHEQLIRMRKKRGIYRG